MAGPGDTVARVGLAALLATGALALLAGCRGDRSNNTPRQFFPDMDDSPKVEAQSDSSFFADGRAMREPVAGTVPFGRRSAVSVEPEAGARLLAQQRADLLRESDAVYRGVSADGSYMDRVPLTQLFGLGPDASVPQERVRDLLALGKKTYEIYCIACHGGSGDGDGMVGARWSAPIPSYHQPQYYPGGEKGQDGYIFHVIRNGVANPPDVLPPLRMPSYAESVSEREAWAVVAYIRALQQTRRSGEMSAWRREVGSAEPTVADAPKPSEALAGDDAQAQPEESSS